MTRRCCTSRRAPSVLTALFLAWTLATSIQARLRTIHRRIPPLQRMSR